MSDNDEKTLDEIEEMVREGADMQQTLLSLLGTVRAQEQRIAVLEDRVDELEAGSDEEEDEGEEEEE